MSTDERVELEAPDSMVIPPGRRSPATLGVLATGPGPPPRHPGDSEQKGGKNVDEGSRYGMAKVNRQAKPAEQGRCRQTQPADDPTGTGLEETTAADDPAGTGLAAKQQPADEVGRPLAVQCRLVEGVRWCWPLRRRARTYLTISLPPIAFACLRPYPLP